VPTQVFISNVWCRISGLDNIEIADALDRSLSYLVEGHQYMRAFTQGWFDKDSGQWRHWDGRRHLLTQKMVFPIGLLTRVLEILDRGKIDYSIYDQRETFIKEERFDILNRKPWPHQVQAVEAALKEERGIIRIGTGGGKTTNAAMIVAEYNVPTSLFVIGKDLLYQFYKEMQNTLGPENVGIIGDGLCDVRKFNVCSVWTAVTAFDLKTSVSLDDEDWAPEVVSIGPTSKRAIQKAIQNARLVIFDEAHFLACDTIQAIFKASKKCRYMFGLTGTDWRDDGADLLLEAACGKRIFNMSASELIDLGYLVPPLIALVEVPPLDNMRKQGWSAIYSDYIVNNELRNQLIVDGAKTLIEMGRKPLILVRSLNHGKKIVDMLGDLPIFFVSGQIEGAVRQEVKENFERGELKCLVASSVFDIGVDIPSLDGLILASGGKSTSRILQRLGRVIRAHEGKKDAMVMDFIDNAKYLDKHSATRIAVYETEPRFKVKFPKGFDRNALKKIKKLKVKIK